jgi:hypothetical protein
MTALQAKMVAYQKAHPDAEEMPAGTDAKEGGAIMSGKLEDAPPGTTLGPSLEATRKGVAEILYAQLGPALGAP